MIMIKTAQQILKEKGFVQNKFDTNGFMDAVAQYFVNSRVEDGLLLVSFRFLSIRNIPSICEPPYVNYNPYDVNDDDVAKGYKVQTARDDEGNLEWANELIDKDFMGFQGQKSLGLALPRIVIDKPFFENAAALLRVMGGYVVEKRKVKYNGKAYWVTLL